MNGCSERTGPAGGSSWIETIVVRGYETDPLGRLSVLSLCQFLQEADGRELARAITGWKENQARIFRTQLSGSGSRNQKLKTGPWDFL